MPTAWERFRALDKVRALAVLLTAIVIVYAFSTLVVGDILHPRGFGRLFGILVSGVLFGAATLLALGPARYGPGLMAAALIAWIAWIVVTAPEAVKSTAIWWGMLAVAALIGLRIEDD